MDGTIGDTLGMKCLNLYLEMKKRWVEIFGIVFYYSEFENEE